MEKVSGIITTVTMAGMVSVWSFQSMLARPLIISIAT